MFADKSIKTSIKNWTGLYITIDFNLYSHFLGFNSFFLAWNSDLFSSCSARCVTPLCWPSFVTVFFLKGLVRVKMLLKISEGMDQSGMTIFLWFYFQQPSTLLRVVKKNKSISYYLYPITTLFGETFARELLQISRIWPFSTKFSPVKNLKFKIIYSRTSRSCKILLLFSIRKRFIE